MKKILSFILIVILCCNLIFSCSALTISDTYSDVTSTSSQANNLINYAMNYNNFLYSDFVIFSDDLNSYYLVWSDDLVFDGVTVSGSDVEFVHYFRSGSAGSYSYSYEYGIDSAFSLSSSFVCTSNIAEFGFRSALFDEYYHRHEMLLLFLLICSFGFVLMILSLRGNKS